MFQIRFWWMLLRALAGAPMLQGKTEIQFLALPFDCDLNFHVNNGLYLRFMDLARWNMLLRMGAFGRVWRSGLRPMAVRVEIDFKRPLPPFALFTVSSEMFKAGAKSILMKQVVKRGNEIIAEAQVTAVFVRNKKAQPIHEFIDLLPVEARQGI